MGMYDFITCHYPLPDGSQGKTEQTKDFFDTCGAHHEITEDGVLLVDFGVWRDVPKEQRTYPDAPDDSWRAMAGSMHWEHRLVAQHHYSGAIGVGDWTVFFIDGKVIAVRPDMWFRDDQESGSDTTGPERLETENKTLVTEKESEGK